MKGAVGELVGALIPADTNKWWPCLSFDFGVSVSLGPFTILVLVITLLACCNRAGRHTPGPTRLSSGENYTFSDPKVCRARARARAIL